MIMIMIPLSRSWFSDHDHDLASFGTAYGTGPFQKTLTPMSRAGLESSVCPTATAAGESGKGGFGWSHRGLRAGDRTRPQVLLFGITLTYGLGTIPLLAEEGWMRHQANAAKPPKRRRRARSASAIARSRNSGQFGPNGFAGLTTPFAPI